MNNNDSKVGLGLVALMALCCGGPLILSLFASGAVLGALGAVWAGGSLLLLLVGGTRVVAAAWLLARRRTPWDGGMCRLNDKHPRARSSVVRACTPGPTSSLGSCRPCV